MKPPLADWMTPVDRDILELLENAGGVRELRMNPRHISVNTDWGHQAIREHVLTLRNADLIEYHDADKGIYQLSERGREYLAGDLDVSELDEE
jgi:predicted transcriptional regulator